MFTQQVCEYIREGELGVLVHEVQWFFKCVVLVVCCSAGLADF